MDALEGKAGLQTKAGVQAELTRQRSGLRTEDIGFGWRFVAATSFGSALNPVNSSIIAVALVAIEHAFGVGASATISLVSALYLATAIGQPTMGRLADLVGPPLGGLLIAARGWRLTFLINVPLAR